MIINSIIYLYVMLLFLMVIFITENMELQFKIQQIIPW